MALFNFNGFPKAMNIVGVFLRDDTVFTIENRSLILNFCPTISIHFFYKQLESGLSTQSLVYIFKVSGLKVAL